MAAASFASFQAPPMDREGVVFGIYNFKGGAAKSTTAVNIAGAMAMQGKKILMLDFDQQCNLTQFFNTTDWMKVDTSALEKAAHCSQQASKLRSQTRHEPPEPPFGAWEDKLADVTEPTDIKAFVNMIDRQKNVNSLFEPVFHECDLRCFSLSSLCARSPRPPRPPRPPRWRRNDQGHLPHPKRGLELPHDTRAVPFLHEKESGSSVFALCNSTIL